MYLRMIILVVSVEGRNPPRLQIADAMGDESELLCYCCVESQSHNSDLLLLTCEV